MALIQQSGGGMPLAGKYPQHKKQRDATERRGRAISGKRFSIYDTT